MIENSFCEQSFASRYWQWPANVKNLLSKLLKWDWPTTKHSPTHQQQGYDIRNEDFISQTKVLASVYYCSSLSPGQPSLVHSHEPWRHTLHKRDICLKEAYFICNYFCVSVFAPALLSHQVLQSWETVAPGGKCFPMCAQEHWDTSTQRLPSKTLPTETHMHAMLLLETVRRRQERDIVSEGLPGHVQPSTHSSLQTSWMLRLWQVVEQDLVHSLYCMPIGHLGTLHKRKAYINNACHVITCC